MKRRKKKEERKKKKSRVKSKINAGVGSFIFSSAMDPLLESRKRALQSPRKITDDTQPVAPKIFELGTNHSNRPKVS